MNNASVTIAGAGIAGLAAALALGPRPALLLEQAAAFSNVGASLQLGPNAVRALRQLGAWDAVEPMTFRPREVHLRDAVSGRLLNRLPLGPSFEARFGAPYCVAQRADLHHALLTCVKARPNLTLRLDVSVSVTRVAEGTVQVNMNGRTATTGPLIAADGVKSRIRNRLFPQARLRDSGDIYHRAQSSAMDVAGVDASCVNVWLYPGGHVVQYPAGQRPCLNVVAVTPPAEEPLFFYRAAAKPLQDVLHAHLAPYTQWPALFVEPLTSWRKANVLLLGDAAHGTLPCLAQGAAMSLEDAAALETALSSSPDIAEAFKMTEARRKARTLRLHKASLAARVIYHHRGTMRVARNLVLSAAPRQFLAQRMAWIYRY